ncbi:MAG: FHA domain-containing protein [Halobacteriovoraceae bacterium]|nr:FHA domain-containing protein [Halobacteriovoraceae bacterium]MCB9093649.1 FHA domain-containing protein [Halobacteriovoraceae bacterium]
MKMNEEFCLVAENVSSSPVIKIKPEMSIGRFAQDFSVDHPDLSPRHCSLYFKDGVFAIIDHHSDKGTFINEKRIPSEQKVILMADDKIMLGGIKLKITKLGETPDVAPPPLPDLPTEVRETFDEKTNDGKTQILTIENLIEEIDQEEESLSKRKPKKEKAPEKKVEQPLETHTNTVQIQDSSRATKKPKMKPTKAADNTVQTVQIQGQGTAMVDTTYGVHFFFRISAFIMDMALSVLITNQLIEYNMLNVVSFVVEPVRLVFNDFLGAGFQYMAPYAGVFILYQVLSNLFLKRTLGQLLLGFSVEKASLGNVRAFLRSLLFFVTFPLLVFDFPALVSRPTVKEILCLSRFYLKSSLKSVLLTAVFLPSVLLISFTIPLFEREPLKKLEDVEFKTIRMTSVSNLNPKVYSRYFNFIKDKRNKTFLTYPDFSVSRVKGKRNISPMLQVYYPAKKYFVVVEKRKLFNARAMLEYALKTNPLAFIRFEEIMNFLGGKPIDGNKFLAEFKDLVYASLTLNFDTLQEHTLKYGPFYKAFFDFRDSLLSTIDTEIKKIAFLKLGDQDFMKITAPGNEELLMTINYPKGIIYHMSFSSIEEGHEFSEEEILDFYKNFFKSVEWKENIEYETESWDAYRIIDFFVNLPEKESYDEEAQQIFAFYYKYSRLLVKSKNETVRNDLIKKMENVLKVLVTLNEKDRKHFQDVGKTSLDQTKYDKLIRKLNEMIENLKAQNLTYFSASMPIQESVVPSATTVPVESSP